MVILDILINHLTHSLQDTKIKLMSLKGCSYDLSDKDNKTINEAIDKFNEVQDILYKRKLINDKF